MICSFSLSAQEIILKSDFKNTQIRSQRVELAVAINPSESFAGDLKISFGTSTTSLTTHLVATISDQDDFTSYENNTRTFVFEQENLTVNTTYYYKWSLETATAGTIEEEIKNIESDYKLKLEDQLIDSKKSEKTRITDFMSDEWADFNRVDQRVMIKPVDTTYPRIKLEKIVEKISTLPSDKKFINKMVKPDYDWTDKEEVEERFMSIVERKFLS